MITLEKSLEKIRQDVTKAFGQDCISVLVYGSAAVDDFEPGKSDINILIVLNEVDLDAVDKARKVVKGLRKYNVSTPLMMTPEHITSSADVFPIEFLEIKEKHQVLFGEDSFANLEIHNDNLRHECEHELKGRILRMRQSYLEIGDNLKALREMLLSGHLANFPAFRTALRLMKIDPPLKKEDVLSKCAEIFSLNTELFLKLKLLRLGELKLTLPMLKDLLNNYLVEVDKIAAAVDRM